MRKTAVITARVDEDTVALIDKVAQAQGRSREAFATRAVERAARAEARFLAFVQEGIDDIEAGRVIPHDVVMAELDAMIAKHEARCRG
jgi:predicted transcriptional regulator